MYSIIKRNLCSFFSRFAADESARLDSIIRRCKRLTGVLIIFKK